jgi:hypothetical protein
MKKLAIVELLSEFIILTRTRFIVGSVETISAICQNRRGNRLSSDKQPSLEDIICELGRKSRDNSDPKTQAEAKAILDTLFKKWADAVRKDFVPHTLVVNCGRAHGKSVARVLLDDKNFKRRKKTFVFR